MMQDLAEIIRNAKAMRNDLCIDDLVAICLAYNDAMRVVYPHAMQEGDSAWLSRM